MLFRSDENPQVSLEEDRKDQGCDNEYTLTRTWTATDECGNSDKFVQVVDVSDSAAPTCRQRIPNGGACNPETMLAINGSGCLLEAECQDGICLKVSFIGEPCDAKSFCKKGECVEGTCEASCEMSSDMMNEE